MTNISKEQEYLQVFQKVTRLISMVLDPQQVMDTVVSRLPTLLELDATTIRLLEPASQTFVMGAAHGLSREYLSRTTIATKETISMLMAGQPVVSTRGNNPEMAREGIATILSLPIVFQGHIIGIMRLLSRQPRDFADTDISFAMSLAEQVGMAIANARLFREMENQVDFLQEVREISRLVNSTLELEEILQTIVEKLPQIMGVKACTIRLLQPETNKLELVASFGLSTAYLQRGSIRKEDSIFQVLKGEPVAIYDAINDDRVFYHEELRREGIRSILAVPIKKANEIIGVLRLLTDTPHTFSANEVSFAVTAAEEGGNAIQNSRTYQKITLLFNQIEENERFLQDILDSMASQLMVLNITGHVVMANKLFLKENNFQEKDVLGQPFERIAPWQGDGCLASQIMADRDKSEAIGQVGSGNLSRWFAISTTSMLSDKGLAEFFIVESRDITATQLLEQEKLKRVKLKAVMEMAGTVAHELNSPLFVALGMAQLMEEDLVDEDMRKNMSTIISNIQIMATLIKKMTGMTDFQSRDYVGETKIIDFSPNQGE